MLEQLPIGRFENAVRYPFNFSPTLATAAPGLNVNSDHRRCNQLTGWFETLEVNLREDQTTVEALAIDFEQRCDGGPVLRGQIRFNSKI